MRIHSQNGRNVKEILYVETFICKTFINLTLFLDQQPERHPAAGLLQIVFFLSTADWCPGAFWVNL